MTEGEYDEIERALFAIGDAEKRTACARRRLSRTNADAHIIDALEEAGESLRRIYRHLSQRTYYANEEVQRDPSHAEPANCGFPSASPAGTVHTEMYGAGDD